VRSGALARWLHVDALHPEDSQVTQALLARCERRGLPVHAWTVNDPGRMRSLALQGVGAVMADDPERLAAELQAVRVGAP
jgi:Glycerophosphoryl diester phosphodiesterase